MILSMTGFAVSTVPLSAPDGSSSLLTIAIKTLNARFFETTCKFPYVLSNLEHPVIKILKNNLVRGHVYCTMHLNGAAVFGAHISPCIKTIENYLSAIRSIKQRFAIEQPFSLDHLVRLPNVFDVTEPPLDDAIARQILQAVEELSVRVIAEREREGAALLHDILYQVSCIRQELAIIEAEARVVLERQKEKVQKNMELPIADEQLAGEIRKQLLYTLDKMDINEEIVRFNSHLDNLTRQLTTTGELADEKVKKQSEKGKQLDFISQELAREINTIAAKCADARIGASAITIKVAVEKIREQVQNIV